MRRVLPLALIGLCVGCAGPPATPELLLLLTVDTLRADHLGAYGSRRGLSPVLDALAQESIVFESAYAPAPFTLPSMAALLTGRYPEQLGIVRNESALPDSAPTLARALRERGWRTAAVVSNSVLRESSGLAAGFDVYDAQLREREATRGWPERRARGTTDAALKVLEGCSDWKGTPCFLWIHYQDPHGPYTPPPGLRERFLEEERRAPDGRRQLQLNESHSGQGGIPAYQVLHGQREVAWYRAGYAGEVVGVDAEIGRLLNTVHALGLWERTLVVFAADHGEALGEHGLWFAHGELLSHDLVHVPLTLRIPGQAPRRRADLVSLVDLYPTLLHLLAGTPPDADAPGRDLLAEGADAGHSTPYLATLEGGAVPRYGWVEDDFLFEIWLRGGVWDGKLTRRGRDPADLTAAAPQVAEAMRQKLLAFRSRLERPGETPQQLSESERERLDALGY